MGGFFQDKEKGASVQWQVGWLWFNELVDYLYFAIELIFVVDMNEPRLFEFVDEFVTLYGYLISFNGKYFFKRKESFQIMTGVNEIWM